MSLKEKSIRSINWDEEEKDITENTVQPDVTVCANKHLGNQEAGRMSVVEDHIPAASQETIASMILQNNAADDIQVKNNMEVISPKNIFKHINHFKKSSKSPSSSVKSKNYVASMINYSNSLKDQEHRKRMEILEVELNIQKEKLKSAILEREILEIRKAKELM